MSVGQFFQHVRYLNSTLDPFAIGKFIYVNFENWDDNPTTALKE